MESLYGQYHLRYNISVDSSHLIQVPVASVLRLTLLPHPQPLKVDALPVVKYCTQTVNFTESSNPCCVILHTDSKLHRI